jgi:Domain of unknown function (DUF4870)
MDCYFHSHVPSIATCTDCRKAICATCRDDMGTCPSCRLAAKVDAASAAHGQIGGTVHQSAQQPPPYQNAWQEQAASAAVHAKAEVAISDDPVESRALVALGYALWPLALISFFDRKRSKYLKRQAIQALGFNVGMAALYGIFTVLGTVFDSIPFISAAPDILRPLLIPVFLVGAVYFGVKAWQGQDVHVPVISDWLDERLPAS